jgi:hypothetical protein
MKSIRIFAFALVLGLAGVVYAANRSQAAEDCCVAGASCCTGEACCTHHGQ